MKKKKPTGQNSSHVGTETQAKPSPEKAKKGKRTVVIDYPQEGEIVTSFAYTIRIGAMPTDRVEISIDDKEWKPCRPNVGYWWYDWSGYNAGPHVLRARIPGAGGQAVRSKPRRFTALI